MPVATDEGGLSLIEVLISIVILGIGVLGIISMTANSLSASAKVKSRADVAQVATRVADAIQRATWACDIAAPKTSYNSTLSGVTVPNASWKVELVELNRWTSDRLFKEARPPVQPPGLREPNNECPAVADDPVFRMEFMKIRITSPNSLSQRTIELYKRP